MKISLEDEFASLELAEEGESSIARMARQYREYTHAYREQENERRAMVKASVEISLKELAEYELKLSKASCSSSSSLSSATATLNEQRRRIDEIAREMRERERRERELIQKEFQRRQDKQDEIVESTLKIHLLREKERQRVEEEAARRVEEERNAQKKKKEEEKKKEELRSKQLEEEERQRLEAEQQNKKKHEESEAAKEKLKQSTLQKPQPPLIPASTEPYIGSQEAISQAEEAVARIKHVKQTINVQVKSNVAMMKEALRYRMLFTRSVGAVTNSKSHILRFTNEIDQALTHGKQTSSDLYVWLLNSLAKHIVKQCESEVHVNFKKAFPLASLTALLIVKHPELKQYLNGRLFKKCIYLIPKYVQRIPGESDDDLRVRMGYRRTRDAFETEESFTERMNGMAAFYFALLDTNLMTQFQVQNSPYSLTDAWLFISRLLNMKPRRISCSLIDTFLKIAGAAFLERYKYQAQKIVRYIRQEFLTRVKQEGGAKVRVEILLDEYDKTRMLLRHEGVEMNP